MSLCLKQGIEKRAKIKSKPTSPGTTTPLLNTRGRGELCKTTYPHSSQHTVYSVTVIVLLFTLYASCFILLNLSSCVLLWLSTSCLRLFLQFFCVCLCFICSWAHVYWSLSSCHSLVRLFPSCGPVTVRWSLCAPCPPDLFPMTW